jgi:hypothetical protein
MAARESGTIADPRAAAMACGDPSAADGGAERLVDGVRLHRGPDGAWRRFGPVEDLQRITGPDAPIAALAGWLERAAGGDLPPELAPTARALGMLEPAPDPRAPRVGLHADGPVGSALRAILRAEGFAVSPREVPTGGGTPDPDPAGVDVVVVVADVQRDAQWRALDARLVAARVPWHRAFREGRRWSVGPFWTAPGDASYADHRIRRLAADPQPDELAARWAAHDAAPTRPGPATPSTAAAVAARLATDLVAWRDGRRAPGVDVEARLDPVLGTVEPHPVLALPPGPSA